MSHHDIRLTEADLTLIIEVSRLGVATLPQLAFATGDFSGGLESRVQSLAQFNLLSQFGREEVLGEDSYAATAEGLVSAYLNDAYKRSRRRILKIMKIKMRSLKLRQKHTVRVD